MEAERYIYQATYNRAKDRQRGMPMIEADLFQSSLGKSEEEINYYDWNCHNHQQDDYVYRKDEELKKQIEHPLICN
jgi:hypothetical protein